MFWARVVTLGGGFPAESWSKERSSLVVNLTTQSSFHSIYFRGQGRNGGYRGSRAVILPHPGNEIPPVPCKSLTQRSGLGPPGLGRGDLSPAGSFASALEDPRRRPALCGQPAGSVTPSHQTVSLGPITGCKVPWINAVFPPKSPFFPASQSRSKTG